MVEVHLEENIKKRRFLFRQAICKLGKLITVEPLILCFILPFHMSTLTIQNLSLEKSCRVNLNLSISICDAITARNHTQYNSSDEVDVQKLVASASIWKNVVYSIFPSILLPFFGAWSDRNKTRKVLMIMPIVGEMITNVGFMLCTFFFHELPLEVNTLIEVLPTATTGGKNMLLVGVFTYVSAITATEHHTIRIGIIHVFVGMCAAIGDALSGVIYTLIGFYGVFTLSFVLYTLGGFYAYFRLNEAPREGEKPLIGFELVKDIVNVPKTFATFKFLAHRSIQTKQIFGILILAVLVVGPVKGEEAVLYMYTRFKFHWNEIDYSMFYGYYSVAHLIGNFFAIALFSKWLKFDDAILGIISSTSKILGGISFTLANSALMFYISTLIESFNGTAFVASRSIVTKLVNEQNLGKVNSLFGVAESITLLPYGPMYSAIYKATIETFPGAFYIAGIFLTVPAIIMYLWLFTKRHSRFPEED
ncbi:uncharacterized protein LOC116160688 [Photinus pyralis]|nr:uncharacterized protein LOC116160688 [Photinus pyralis]